LFEFTLCNLIVQSLLCIVFTCQFVCLCSVCTPWYCC